MENNFRSDLWQKVAAKREDKRKEAVKPTVLSGLETERRSETEVRAEDVQVRLQSNKDGEDQEWDL